MEADDPVDYSLERIFDLITEASLVFIYAFYIYKLR
jgi:hypothetical protein